MKQVDYIIVGCGLAGIAFCEQLRANQKTFVVFDNASQKSSIVAAGLYNPVVLKRFTSVWKSGEQLEIALPMYRRIEERLDVKLDYKIPILRRFASIEEQNLWFDAADQPSLEPYLSTKLISNTNDYINASNGFGEVLNAGRLDTEALIKSYKKSLDQDHRLYQESFNYQQLVKNPKGWLYKDLQSKFIVFAEGFGIKKNPFFNHLPLNGTKGEVLIIEAPDLKIDFGIKSSVFIIPIGRHLYYVGATYNWEDKSQTPTDAAKSELVEKLNTFITCDYKIVQHQAGIRPTVKDRRPLVGEHPNHKGLYVLNGLGTRGVMIAPYVASKLYQLIEHQSALDQEIDIKRFMS